MTIGIPCAFGVREAVKAAGVPLLSEYRGHPSLRVRATGGEAILRHELPVLGVEPAG